MPIKINGIAPRIKKSGQTKIYVYGEELNRGDTVTIRSTSKVWSGDIDAVYENGTLGEVTVQRIRRDMELLEVEDGDGALDDLDDDDVAAITITIASSEPINGFAVLDL